MAEAATLQPSFDMLCSLSTLFSFHPTDDRDIRLDLTVDFSCFETAPTMSFIDRQVMKLPLKVMDAQASGFDPQLQVVDHQLVSGVKHPLFTGEIVFAQLRSSSISRLTRS